MGNDGGAEERFAAAVRGMREEAGPRPTLERTVAVATHLIDGCDHAAVSLVHRSKRIDTPAATSEVCRRGDLLQYELQQGPCLDAIWQHETVHCPDLLHESRWPRWAPRVVHELGIRSMLCFQLFTDEDSLGALNLYAESPNAFGEPAEALGFALAAHAAEALVRSRGLDHMNTAILNRAVVAQAQGILMERYVLSAEQALELLSRVARSEGVQVHILARSLVGGQELPDAS
jgi:GAF domain-containing protein